ncbi:hypothetical protein EON80_17195 [bacterium]|nr:MAG: hypothetical protein EON80_17195 [bacterium]
MNTPPIPQPSAQTCPNCGAAVEGGLTMCPRCGAVLRVASGGASCITMMVQIVLGCLAMTFGLTGACFVLIGGAGGGLDSSTLVFVGGGLFGVVLAGLCIWGIIALSKSRR